VRGGGVSIGKVFGVRITVHPSWILIFLFVVIWLGSVGGPTAGSAIPDSLRWLAAPLVATTFFASVLLHELAHALVARRQGVPVDEVMLFIFGGAARLEQDAPDPRTEAVITIAGPVSSLLLGLLLLGMGTALDQLDGLLAAVVVEVCLWLGAINLFLAAFNMIPGFPMDGGRLLRAILWARTRDFLRATRLATRVGGVFAFLLIGAGALLALAAGNVVLGIWTAVIGWFLYQTAQATYRRVELRSLVEGVAVQDVMDREIPVVHPNLTLDTFVDQYVGRGGSGLYPVTANGTLVGTIDVGQVRRVARTSWPTTRVHEVMSRGDSLWTLTERQPVMDALGRFQESDALAIPVVDLLDGQRLIGLVTRDGLLRALRQRETLRGG
jgi:Zn-dependent protease